jgi:hypothetical protein
MAPTGLSIRSARRASTARISSSTSPMVATIAPVLSDGRAALVTALIFVIDPTAVTMFLNIQK